MIVRVYDKNGKSDIHVCDNCKGVGDGATSEARALPLFDSLPRSLHQFSNQ